MPQIPEYVCYALCSESLANIQDPPLHVIEEW